MDQELKQRLIGVAVITALAAIFIPMLFDNPVDESGQIVNELTIPEPPVQTFEETAQQVPPAEAVLEQKADDEVIVPDGEDQYLPLNEEYVEDAGQYTADFRQNYSEIGDLGEGAAPQVQTVQPDTKTSSQAGVSENDPLTTLADASIDPVQEPLNTPAVSSAVPDATGWYIQLGSFSKQENASTLYNKLKADGFPVILDEIRTPAGKAYRLRVGPESDKNKAVTIKSKLDQQHKLKSILTGGSKPAASDTLKSPAQQVDKALSAKAEKSVADNPPASVRWFVQLGTFTKQENAVALRDKLRSKGFSVNFDEITTSKGKAYRLKAGPELNKKKAEEMKAKLDKVTNSSTLLKAE
ncbi:SPOR domain-containing protein [Methylicorpusculum oleiharenae]|uniref:SPOR domain-containing protein n=1 Tax=Methylicorpusculum oleiharenae TaxID=1338687 RepID=UPI00135A1C16|nr:SPOR domain-containing protein [Methylicorpusculum oleiharenae]MCD2452197.1 SPOR domain-containing protein [Methylicorpusculum oleiharenae]